LDALYKEDKKSRPLGLMFFFVNSPSKEIAGEVIGKVLTWVIAYRVPACYRAEERVDLMLQMDQTAFALASYHADHGQYPDKLDELIPKYLSEIPDDTFADQPTPVRYRREGEAHMMWTVHLNGIDDDGRTADDVPPGDDWVLRPVPKEKATK
jgi:hypothetical protein